VYKGTAEIPAQFETMPVNAGRRKFRFDEEDA
jgi:hypothetical protein